MELHRGLTRGHWSCVQASSQAVEDRQGRPAHAEPRRGLGRIVLLQIDRGQDFLLPVVVQPSSLVRSYGAPPDRKHPYVLRLQRVNYDSLLVELGESFELARLPEGVALAGKFFTYSLSFREEEGGIRVDRRLEIRPGRLEPDEFPAFLKLLQDADNAEKERIVLRKIKRS